SGDAQIRGADHGRRRARRRAVRQHAEGSEQLGQGLDELRADGLRRGHGVPAADRRQRVPQEVGEGPQGAPLLAAAERAARTAARLSAGLSATTGMPTGPVTAPARRESGLGYMVQSAFWFAVMGLLVKLASAHVPVM